MAHPARGAMYDDKSLSWRINSKWPVILGGQRAVIMQTAEPRIAAAVLEHSQFKTDPMGRLQRTMDSMMVIGFGRPDERKRVLDHLEELHESVKGRTPGGQAYSALDKRLMYWVLATITDTIYEVDRRYVGKLSQYDRERFFDEGRPLAQAFKIDDRFIPENYRAFREYMAEQIERIEPSEQSRDVARELLKPNVPMVPSQVYAPLDWITVELLPSTMRQRLHLGALNPMQLAAVRSAQQMARTAIPLVPRPLMNNPFTAWALRKAA